MLIKREQYILSFGILSRVLHDENIVIKEYFLFGRAGTVANDNLELNADLHHSVGVLYLVVIVLI